MRKKRLRRLLYPLIAITAIGGYVTNADAWLIAFITLIAAFFLLGD